MRHIFIGDVHGCYDELQRLLDRVAPSPKDVVAATGDLVNKGPAPEECLRLWRDRGYHAVLGNQEEKLITRRDPLARYVREWPLYLDFERAGVAVVHGGLFPETAITRKAIESQRASVTTLRYIRREGDAWRPVPKNEQQPGDRFWSELWDGERTIVYGHTPRNDVRRDAKAIGLDTACVYGGKLTAAILEEGAWSFVSVNATRNYASPSPLARVRRWLRLQ